MVLNGIGNGMMIGTAPFLAMELYHQITGWEIPRRASMGNAFALVAGSALGAWSGYQEAKQLHTYREAMTDALSKMQDQVESSADTLKGWTERVESGQPAPDGLSR